MAKRQTSNFIQRFLEDRKKKKDKELGLTVYSKAATDQTEIAFVDTNYFLKPQGKKQLEILYRNNWAVWKGVNVRANLLSSRGLKIVCKSDRAKEVINKFLKHLHPTRPILALQHSFRNRSINTDVFGTSHDELLFTPAGTKEKPLDPSKAKELHGFKTIHPINIDLQRDEIGKVKFKNGVPLGWHFYEDPGATYDPEQSVKLPFKRVAFLKYNSIGDEILGMSSLEPIYKTAERLLKIEEGITQGILTHGNPLHDVIVGDEAHPPTKKMIDNVSDQVQGLNTKSEYVHPPWIRVGQIESFSLGKALNYTQPYLTAISAGLGVPEFILLGRGEGTNKATAQAMINFIHQTIEPLQQEQAMYFEGQILEPLMRLNNIDEVPTIEWNEILPRNPNDYAQVIKVLSEAMIGGKQIISTEEIRELAGLGRSADFKKPTGELAEVKKTTLPGIYLVSPHGKLIWEGKKKLIIKSVNFEKMTMKPLYLVSDNKVYGIIKLRKAEKIKLEEFDDLKKKHLISEKEREKWWEDKETLFSYKFNILEKFKVPKDFSVPKGAQTFISEVSI